MAVKYLGLDQVPVNRQDYETEPRSGLTLLPKTDKKAGRSGYVPAKGRNIFDIATAKKVIYKSGQ